MDLYMTKKDFEAAAEKFRAAIAAQGIATSVRIEQFDAGLWLLLVVCPKPQEMDEDSFDKRMEAAFLSCGLKSAGTYTEDEFRYSGFSPELGGYVWVVMHPEMPSSVKEMAEREFLDETCWGDVYQDFMDGQKGREEAHLRFLSEVEAMRLQPKKEYGYLDLPIEVFCTVEMGRRKALRCCLSVKLIGLKTAVVRCFGEVPRKMWYVVDHVTLEDEDGRECDPFDVPKDFDPRCVKVHLGERID